MARAEQRRHVGKDAGTLHRERDAEPRQISRHEIDARVCAVLEDQMDLGDPQPGHGEFDRLQVIAGRRLHVPGMGFVGSENVAAAKVHRQDIVTEIFRSLQKPREHRPDKPLDRVAQDGDSVILQQWFETVWPIEGTGERRPDQSRNAAAFRTIRAANGVDRCGSRRRSCGDAAMRQAARQSTAGLPGLAVRPAARPRSGRWPGGRRPHRGHHRRRGSAVIEIGQYLAGWPARDKIRHRHPDLRVRTDFHL